MISAIGLVLLALIVFSLASCASEKNTWNQHNYWYTYQVVSYADNGGKLIENFTIYGDHDIVVDESTNCLEFYVTYGSHRILKQKFCPYKTFYPLSKQEYNKPLVKSIK